MAGTGLWRSQLMDRRCPACNDAMEKEREQNERAVQRRAQWVELSGGQKPCREFTFERYRVAPGNELAYERCHTFNPAAENLYLWGPCGVGKTHLAYAAAGRCFDETLSVVIQPAAQLTRKVRMKDPVQEQASIDQFVGADVLLLDDFGIGPDTPFSRQLQQEILDRRDFADRAGLILTSRYSLDALAEKLGDDSIPSRLAGMCLVIQIQGADVRLTRQPSPYNSKNGSVAKL
jgi:DNA replication protein DnaC